MKKRFLALSLVAVFLVSVMGLIPVIQPEKTASADPVFPLKVSSNDRYLVDQNNDPFYIKMDTAWQISGQNWNAAYVTNYLNDRQAKGFNAILVVGTLWNPIYTTAGPVQYPYNNPPNMSTPREAYFANLDQIIDACASRGIVVFLNALNWQGGYDGTYEGGGGPNDHLTEANARAAGQYLGNRYKNKNNIIWVHGGDTKGDDQTSIDNSRTIYALVAQGIEDNDTVKPKLHTYHIGWRYSTSDFFPNAAWIDFNMYQTFTAAQTPNPNGGCATQAYTIALDDYWNHGTKPTFFVEPCYETNEWVDYTPLVTPYHIRQATGWGMLSGSAGIGYGHKQVWRMQSNVMNYTNTPGVQHYVNIMNMITARAWQKLVPDRNAAGTRSLVTAGGGAWDTANYATAAIASDDSFGLVYMPNSRAVTVDKSQFSGPVTIKKYDPTNNTTTTVVSNSPNTGTYQVAAPGNNSAGQSDWFLILEAGAAPTPTPTVAPTPPPGGNLIANASFETGTFDSWGYGAPFTISTEQAHAGTYSVKLVNASTWGYLGQVVSVTPGTDYTWKLWIRSSGANGAQMRVLRTPGDGGGILPGTTALNNQGGSIWREYTINFNSGSYSQLILSVSDSASGKTHYIDDMMLTADGSPPSTPTPPPPSNLITNPSFETGVFTPWGAGAPFTISTEQAHASTYSVKLVNANTWGYLGQTVNVATNTDYTWKLWIRSSGSTGARMRVLRTQEDGGGLLPGTNYVDNTGGSVWTQYTINFNSGSYSQVVLSVSDSASGKTHYIDDMTLTAD